MQSANFIRNKRGIKLELSAFLVFFMLMAVFPPKVCAAGALQVQVTNDLGTVSGGGTWDTINITGATSSPVINITTSPLTILGSKSGNLVNLHNVTLNINNTVLNLGSPDIVNGGSFYGGITLQNNGQLHVYGDPSIVVYAVNTQASPPGTITGNGSVALSHGAYFSTGAIGAADAHLPSLFLEGSSRLHVVNGLWADNARLAGGSMLEERSARGQGNLTVGNLTLAGSSGALSRWNDRIVDNLVSSADPDNRLNYNFIEAQHGDVIIKGTIDLLQGLTSIRAENNITILDGEVPGGSGELYLRANGSLTINSGEHPNTSFEALNMKVNGNLVAKNVTAAQLEAGTANISGNLTILGDSAEFFGYPVEYGALKLTGESRVGGDLNLSQAEIDAAGNITVVGDAALQAARGQFHDLHVNGDFSFGAGTLRGDNLTAGGDVILGNRQFDTTLTLASLTADNLSALGGTRNTVTASGNVTVAGIVEGDSGLDVRATGDIAANSIDAGHIAANNVVVRNGALNLSGSAESDIQHDLAIKGSGQQGTFGSLKVGGKLSIDGSGLSGENLSAASIIVGSATSPTDLHAQNLADGAAIGVGGNARMTIGQSNGDWLKNSLNGSGNAGNSALGVYAPYVLGSGGLSVNPSSPSPVPVANQANFAPGSLLVVNGENAEETTHPDGLISASTSLQANVANGARLAFEHISANKVYGVLGHNITTNYASDLAWDENNLESGAHLIGVRKIPGRDGWFSSYQKPASDIYPPLDPGIRPPLDGGVGDGSIGTENRHFNSDYAGVRFLSRVTSVRYMDHDRDLSISTMESAVRMAVLGGTQQMTYAANTSAAEAGQGRASFSGNAGILQQDNPAARTVALWILPLFRNVGFFDIQANNFDYDFNGDMGGIVFGGDWTYEDRLRFGLDASIGGGYAKSGGDLAKTTNNMGFAGIGAYAGLKLGDFSLAVDGHYTWSWNSLKQQFPSCLEMRNPEGDLTARAISGSFRADYHIPLGDWLLSPHAGLRYTWLHTDQYTFYSNGAMTNGDGITQNIWTFPTGLELQGFYQTESGWTLKPLLDFFVIPAAGDINARTKVRFTGVPGEADVETQTMDYWRFGGKLGLEANLGNFSLGLNYNLLRGAHSTEQAVIASLRYEF